MSGEDRCNMEHKSEIASLHAEVRRLDNYRVAYEETSRRAEEAHEYASRQIGAPALGRNVWHAVLDDAIRLRADLDHARADLAAERERMRKEVLSLREKYDGSAANPTGAWFALNDVLDLLAPAERKEG